LAVDKIIQAFLGVVKDGEAKVLAAALFVLLGACMFALGAAGGFSYLSISVLDMFGRTALMIGGLHFH
jgi:hypothetical protein